MSLYSSGERLAVLPYSDDLSPVGVPHVFETLGLTFDDVLLQPAESDIIPSEVSTASRISKRISHKASGSDSKSFEDPSSNITALVFHDSPRPRGRP
jgi:hypothetical protein